MANRLKNNFVYQLLLSSTQVLLPLTTYPYITRVLGPEHLGRINYIDFVSQIFIIVAAFGIPFYGTREVSKLRHQPVQRSILVKELSIVHLFFALCCTACFLLLFNDALQYDHILGLLAAANILISSFSYEWYIMGMEQFQFAAIRTIIIRLLMLAGCFTLIQSANDYPYFFAVFTGAMLLTAIANAVMVYQQQVATSTNVHPFRHIKPLFHFFLTASAIGIYEYVGTVILGRYIHNEAIIGYYTMMHKMILVILAMLIAFSGVLSPRISYLIAIGQADQARRYMNRFIELLMVLCIPASVGIFIFAPELVYTVAGYRFTPAVPIVRILCFLPLVVGVTNVFCNQVLVAFHQEKRFMVVALLGCVVSISANILLVPKLSAEGTAWASLITESCVAFVSGWMACRYIKLQLNIAVLVTSIALALLFWPIAALLRYALQSPLLVLIAGIGLSGGSYLLLQMVWFKNESLLELYAYGKELMHKRNITAHPE